MVATCTTKINGILVKAGEELPVFTENTVEVDVNKDTNDITFEELKALGKERKIKGYHLMSEEKLRNALGM
jgi:hypothetical protein